MLGSGLAFYNAELTPDGIGYSDITVITDFDCAAVQEYWYRSEWRDGVSTFWRELEYGSGLRERSYSEPGKRDTGPLSVKIRVRAGERGRVRFILSWNVPNQYNYWSPCKTEDGRDVTWKNYYATVYEDSRASAARAAFSSPSAARGERR